jgi:hypothetical protein
MTKRDPEGSKVATVLKRDWHFARAERQMDREIKDRADCHGDRPILLSSRFHSECTSCHNPKALSI